MNYDDIRPYEDHEVNQYIQILLKDEVFQEVLSFIFSDPQKIKEVSKMLVTIQSVDELQMKFMYPLIKEWIIDRTTSGISYDGLENLNKDESYLFVSNHRDIILDAAILNFIIANAGMKTTEIAMGDNLLIYDWIGYTVKLNRAFIVRRNLPSRELLAASQKLSSYIRETIFKNQMSVWIAQREGRTKNGCDQTQQALLKMLNLSNTSNFTTGFRQLKIVPLSISYEREPCGISKVEELYRKAREGFVKTPSDDLKSMAFGLTRPKGRVHFSFGKPIDGLLDCFPDCENQNENIPRLAEYIDRCIYKNYKLWPNNYLAADMLLKENKYALQITRPVREKFEEMLDDLVETIGEGDARCQRELFLKMYANPLFNAEKVKKDSVSY